MFLLLADLQAGQVGVAQVQLVFLLEVLQHAAVHSVPRLQHQGEAVGGMNSTHSNST